MSEETMSEETAETETEAPVEKKPPRGSIPKETVEAIIAGIPSFPKRAFLMVGHAQDRGTRLAVALTKKVGRVYFYGEYDQLPGADVGTSFPGIRVYTEEERKAERLGGVIAAVDFSASPEDYLAAFRHLVDVVRTSEPPPARPARQPKATASTEDEALPVNPEGEADPGPSAFSDA